MTDKGPACEALLQTNDGWLRMHTPVEIVEARSPERVGEAIAAVERLTRTRGLFAAGFVTYEAGAAYGLAVAPAASDGPPLVWFALFPPAHVSRVSGPVRDGEYEIRNLHPTVDRPRFDETFAQIKSLIADGHTYQANYTFRMRGSFAGDDRALFADLVAAQRGGHSAFIRLAGYSICSASPELFFSRSGDKLAARPMKGTARRGRTLVEDRERAGELHDSAKQRAENVMIVDMVRNDLGRVAAFGSVEVPELFTVERYPNVWQMTSLVTARSPATLAELFAALHPSASVTGAPKVRTMELLAQVESGPRGVYTGAIGLVEPDGRARFSVAIRTAVVNHSSASVEFGVGSGIVWDSDPADEYAECLLKGSVLDHRPRPFELLETLRWAPGAGFFLLDRHLERLCDSAEYFGFAVNRSRILDSLDHAVGGQAQPQRVRLLVDREGRVRVERQPLVPGGPLSVRLAHEPIDATDVYLFHKTTNRAAYERARIAGSDDVILWNREGEITESTLANVVVELEARRVTPPVTCGLLAGTFRAELLARGEVVEGVVTVDDLRRATAVWLVNSVYEWRRARMTW